MMDSGMTIFFSTNASFVFDSLSVSSSSSFMLSLIPVFIFGFALQGLCQLHCELVERKQKKLKEVEMSPSFLDTIPISLVNSALYLFAVISMFLMMTCNGWVILALIAGTTAGYSAFLLQFKTLRL